MLLLTTYFLSYTYSVCANDDHDESEFPLSCPLPPYCPSFVSIATLVPHTVVMNATDAERTAVLVATAADVDESPNASAVIPSDSFMARQQDEAAKKGWERWPVPPHLPAEAVLENMDARGKEIKMIDWLTAELRQEASSHADEVNGDGTPNTERLEVKCKAFFRIGRTYINMYQAKQHAELMLSQWGAHIKCIGSSINCHYGGTPRIKTTTVSPGRQRKSTQSALLKCPFKVPYTFLYNSSHKNVNRALNPVRISEGLCLEHSCDLTARAQAVARTRSGYYTQHVNQGLLDPLLRLNPATLPASTLRNAMSSFIPGNVEISPNHINNFRLRLMQMSLTSDYSVSDLQSLTQCKGLDADEMALLDHDISLANAEELLREVLNSSSTVWKVEKYLQVLQSNDPSFAYAIMRDDEDRPIGVVWTTKTMREHFVRFGETLSLDAQKKKRNKLSWSYLSLVVVDENHSPRATCEGLFVCEAGLHYVFLVNFLFDIEKRRTRSTVHIIWSDGILRKSFLEKVGLPEAQLVLDQWHLVNKIWPEYFGAEYFKRWLMAPMLSMCNASSLSEFDAAFDKVKALFPMTPRNWSMYSIIVMNAIALPRTALMRYLNRLAEEVVSLQSRTTQV